MEKIDLTDKFIHSPNWQNKQDLENFKNIIKSGVLLTPEELSLKEYWFKDKIFFAVHPDSELALEYCGIGYNGFDSGLAQEYQDASKALEVGTYSKEPVKK